MSEDFSEKTVAADPFVQFGLWYRQHLSSGQEIPESFTLATASEDGKVSARTVLLKDFDANGFTFFTNYTSKKGSQLSVNHHAAMLFYWPESKRQVRVEGITEKTSEQVSAVYFRSRPRESQLAAWASEQSTVIPDKKFLDERFEYYSKKFESRKVEKPVYWGGYRIIPYWFEFWQDRLHRLHDRITYTRKENIWIIERLSP